MKLLLDENLSDKIIARISDLFADCAHVKHVALARADDGSIADWAKDNDFAIVSKDTDFLSEEHRIWLTAKVHLAARWQLRNRHNYRPIAI